MLSELLEAVMLVAFGAAWPASLFKSYQARSAKSKSLFFLLLVGIGYVSGITAKIISGNVNYILCFYAFNLMAVLMDLVLYFRNRRFDAMAAKIVAISKRLRALTESTRSAH